ncbi:hypothetical protein WS68_08020 [Burkholderia sp. TSV86]|nr:hypothetical protein WS68_08020 [Burkholderia sp. TSV86]
MKPILCNRAFWLFLAVLITPPVLPGVARVPQYWIMPLNYIGRSMRSLRSDSCCRQQASAQ